MLLPLYSFFYSLLVSSGGRPLPASGLQVAWGKLAMWVLASVDHRAIDYCVIAPHPSLVLRAAFAELLVSRMDPALSSFRKSLGRGGMNTD